MGLIICILVNVAFITLIERKILGYSQIRKGPNKVRIIGLIQPFNDAIKLFSKELVIPNQSNKFQFFLSPILGLIIVLIIFFFFPFFRNKLFYKNINHFYLYNNKNKYLSAIIFWLVFKQKKCFIRQFTCCSTNSFL